MTMETLLPQSGRALRGRNRADCTCGGRSRGTVSFSDELAHCFRCGWKANTRTLARELGLLSDDPESRRQFAAEQRERERREHVAQRFERWRNGQLSELMSEYRQRGRAAAISKAILARCTDSDAAWDGLAAFYHREAALCRSMDFLSCARATPWLSKDATINDVFAVWQQKQKAAA